jgi:Fe-S-cluster containining protein
MDYSELLEELVSNPGYIDGRRRFPRTFTPYDALILTGTLHANVDRGCEARAGAARARGLVIACAEGCNHCCEHAVTVYLPEAIRIAEWLRLDENREAKEAFLAAYPAWRERVGDGFDRIFAAVGDDAKLAAHLEQWQKKVMCAFNREGRCAIYAVRPVVCRNCHAVGTSERCQAERYDGRLPEAVRFPPLERYVAEAQRADKAMHHALGGPRGRKQALCVAVYELLTSDRHAAAAPPRPA